MIDHGILRCGFHGLRQKAARIFRSVFRVPFVLFLQRFRNKAGTVVKQSASQPAQKAGHLIKMTLIQSGRQPSPVVGGETIFLAHHADSHKEHAAGQILGAAAAVPSDKGKVLQHFPLVFIQRQLLQELGREPTPEEIGKEMGLPAERVREIQKISQEPVSLETPIGEEEDSQLGDFIEDDAAVVPPDAASFSMLQEQLSKVLDGLAERERKVIALRFGLEDGHPRTLEEVGREFGVTRERIRQIESKTLAKLRPPSRSSKLKDYLED